MPEKLTRPGEPIRSPTDPSITPLEAAKICQDWISKFQSKIDNADIPGIVELFIDDGWWRDMLTIDFDLNSLRKRDIQGYLERFGIPHIKKIQVVRPTDAILVAAGSINWVQAYLTYETDKFRGKGFVRLIEEDGQFLRAFTLFTSAWEVIGHEEFAYRRRPFGAEIHSGGPEARNWKEMRDESVEFVKSDPSVLVIGAGHNGLMIAARLGALHIPTLVIDKNGEVGDNWAKRYHNLVLHDPVWADHFPYIPYPPQWPIFSPKDKLAQWFRSYVDSMEINVWTRSTLQGGASYDKVTGKWTVTVIREGNPPRTMKVTHIIQATGLSGEPYSPKFAGMEDFKGTICHSSQHTGGKGWKGKKAIVVGCCNSGLDIAAEFFEEGADVTVVQRSSTYVVSSKYGVPALLKGFYEEDGPALPDADLMLQSLPISLAEQFQTPVTKIIEELDKEMRDGLESAGFKLTRYSPGIFIKYFKDAGGYYIDVGCAKLIADKKIMIKQGQEIARILPNGVEFADGDVKEADVIVLATGYGSLRDATRSLMGPEVADAVHTYWNLDKQGEIQTCWRNSGVPGFWLQCGNFFQGRCFSRILALQIQMIELGLADKYRPYPVEKEIKDPRF